MLEEDIEGTLISQEETQVRCKELGKELTEIYQNADPLVVGVLKGAVPFMAGIARLINMYLELDLMDVSSHGDVTVPSGEVKIVKDLDTNVEGRDLLIVEDIIDSGRTFAYLVDLFEYRKAKSVRIVTLLDKPEGRVVNTEADYVGFDVPNEFVVGYGLNYVEAYRNLPYTGVPEPGVYQLSQCCISIKLWYNRMVRIDKKLLN